MKIKHQDEIAVIGAGRFGQAVIDQLLNLNKNIVILDEDQRNLKRYEEDIDRIFTGDAADTKVLMGIGIDNIDTVVVAVSENVEIVSALQELKVKNIIARAISARHARVLKQIGANVIIKPEAEAGIRAALIAANNNFIKYGQNLQEIGDNFVIGSTSIKNETLIQKQVKDLGLNERGITIVLIKSNGISKRATGDVNLKMNDVITIIGEIGDVTNALAWFNNEN
ncbi:potassium channel family protein [Mycoplasma nasistruthionis]|uniref:TrkA family potassium uptake protein n=1 Tax=Mycoplasma nasistruthionis TaxID=353852 RepID=A0A4Y6I689_9MOLU|nr:TrkA family potassium uptake protein [Mycoplasma nasistruthionis]QCZ36572.1 TrkA family potassium uptake protein [Mycoplasma nasistruthionis]QDF64871.1 TrkA family potassium uptake protein [Mycoplasma nasistruthionis]